MSSSPITTAFDEAIRQIPDGVVRLQPVTDSDRVSLLDALAQVPDPRRRRGVRYSFTVVLTVVVCAMLSGARSFTAIGEWAADLPVEARASLGLCRAVPGTVTIWRIIVRVDRARLEAAIGGWIQARLDALEALTGTGASRRRGRGRRVRRVLAVDGKALRATGNSEHPVHLLGVLDHATGVVLAQINVDAKTNEIPLFAEGMDQVRDLTDTLITVDALHAQTEHAEYLHGRGAHLLVTVKGNRPTLHAQLKALPWKDVPIGHTMSDRAHGRIEERTLKVVTVQAGIAFPHAAQAIQVTRRSRPITRNTKKTKRKKRRARIETVYAIITLPAEDAQPAELAAWLRGHWGIENRLHWVRDVTLGEDLHQARTGSGPQVMAALRNLIISLLRFAEHTNIAKALRWYARHTEHAIMLVTSANTTTK